MYMQQQIARILLAVELFVLSFLCALVFCALSVRLYLFTYILNPITSASNKINPVAQTQGTEKT